MDVGRITRQYPVETRVKSYVQTDPEETDEEASTLHFIDSQWSDSHIDTGLPYQVEINHKIFQYPYLLEMFVQFTKNECTLGVQTDNEDYYSGVHSSKLVMLNKNSPDRDTTSVSSLKTNSEMLRPLRRDLVLVEKPPQQKTKPKKEKRLVKN